MSTAIVINQHEEQKDIGSIIISIGSETDVDQVHSEKDPFLELSLTMDPDMILNSKITRSSSFDYKGLPRPILIKEDTTGGCGGKTWEAADVSCNYLIWKYKSSNGNAFKGKTILELGSGTGLVGLVLGAMCNPLDANKIVITDQIPMLSLMEANIDINNLGRTVRANVLDWGVELPQWLTKIPDIIIASDCVYLEVAFQPLIDSLLLLSNENTEIYLCYKRRRKADKRFFTLARKQFTITEVTEDPHRPGYERNGLHLYLMKRKL
ncbi:putative methyltransferase-domain-containing protein [Umbelopsis sp. AD052]|nr:putative methyltransferase-domain-containing protein [Umbelopsis sp. AD052]